MRNTRKLFVALVLVMTLLMTMAVAVIPASAATPEKLYLTPNANWKQDGARFAAYFFGNGEKWVSMTDSDKDGIYEVDVPAGYPSVIFCRMNPSASANNWTNKWNQTADLTVPTSGANHYTVKEGTWDNGGGTWSTFGSTCPHANLGPAATCTTAQECKDCGDPVVSALGHTFNTAHLCTRCNEQASFTVAGSGAHMNGEWAPANTANDMTYDAETGTYTKVYTNVAAGSYKLKVARDHDWGTAYPSADKAYTVATTGSTVTVTLKGTTVDIKVEAPHVHNFVDGKCECGESDPNYVPPHVNTLVVGDTNKIVIGDAAIDNGYGYLVESVLFTADEKAHYKFAGEGLTILVYDLSMNNLCGFTGEADLDAGMYIICIAANTPATKGEFNVAVTKSEIVVAPSLDNLTLWASDTSLYTVDGYNIKYNGAGNTYACVGTDVTAFAAGNNTFTITITNNGAAIAKVRVDLQATVQVGNHKVVNVGAVGGDVWTDSEWGGSHVHVAPGESVTLVITYDETTERGAVKDLIIFADSGRGDAETYSADITISGLEFSKVSDEPAHENKLVLGETNKIYVDDSINNGIDYYVAIVPFEVTEAGKYSFVNASGMALVYDADVNNLCGYTGTADLEVGTYYIWISAYTTLTTGMFDVTVTKVEVGGDDPVEPPVEVEIPALVLGENTVVIDGTHTNIAGQPIAWLELVVTEAGAFKVSSEELNCYICADMSFNNVLCGWTGTANLEAGTYYVAVGNSGITGEFTVNLEKLEGEVELPAVNTLVVGENVYVINEALKNVGFEFLYFTADKTGLYTFSGVKSMIFFIWPDFPNQTTVSDTDPFIWNLDLLTADYTDSVTVELTEGCFYLVGFKFVTEDGSVDTPVGEYNINVSFEEKAVDTPDTPDTPADPQPEEPAVELNFFQQIMKAITDFFAQISAWFENLFAGLKK